MIIKHKINTILISLIKYFFLLVLGYMIIFFSIYFFSVFLLVQGVTPNNILIKEYQRNFYHLGNRNIWQGNKDCIQFDEDLIFVPKYTTCKFNNLEFETTLTFNQFGRYSDYNKNNSNKLISIIGDSHGMGWGVNDNETFSYVLEKKLQDPVVNLSVAGYGTIRQLIHLEKSGLMDRIETVIIQYCDNDLGENLTFQNLNEKESKEKFELLISEKKIHIFKKLRKYFRFSQTIPIDILREKNKLNDFSTHEKSLIKTLKKFPSLSDKRIIIFNVNWFETDFYNYPFGRHKELKNVYFVDLNLKKEHFFRVDGHLNENGHHYVANKLSTFIKKEL